MSRDEADIEAWLMDAEEIPTDSESEDEEKEGGLQNFVGNYIVAVDGTLQQVDYLEVAQRNDNIVNDLEVKQRDNIDANDLEVEQGDKIDANDLEVEQGDKIDANDLEVEQGDKIDANDLEVALGDNSVTNDLQVAQGKHSLPNNNNNSDPDIGIIPPEQFLNENFMFEVEIGNYLHNYAPAIAQLPQNFAIEFDPETNPLNDNILFFFENDVPATDGLERPLHDNDVIDESNENNDPETNPLHDNSLFFNENNVPAADGPERHDAIDESNENVVVLVDDEDTEPLAKRLYDEKVEWYKQYFKHKKKNTFNEETCPQIEADSSIEAFTALFPDDLVDLLVDQTNRYATQAANGPIRRPTEMNIFLGLNIMMGIKRLPSYRDSYISKFMSVNRFGWLLLNLHINDNNSMPKKGEPNFDKLYKIRPFFNRLLETYKSSYVPSREQSIDESMIRFKGCSSLKPYMPDKRIRRGYKVWV